MDGQQAIGLCRSVMKHNDPEYSGISNDTPPEEVASEFIKLCWRHGKEPIHDFKSLVSAEQYARIQDVFYIDSKKSLEEFSTFIYGLGQKKISDWWKHKEMHAWILPCIVKSQSRIPADVWDSTPSTTNTNEAQHHWTNSLTGIKLTPVEALESRRKVDENVAREIQMSLQTGILSNPNNELAHRMARNGQRQSAAVHRARESRKTEDVSKELQRQLDASIAATKSLKEQLKAAKAPSGRRGKSKSTAVVLSASSSGRVRTARTRKDAPVQPTQSESDVSLNTVLLTTNPVQEDAQPMPVEWVQPSADTASSFDANIDSLLASLGFPDTGFTFPAQDLAMTQVSSLDPILDPAVFGFDFNMLMPFESGMLATGPLAMEPLNEFMSYGMSSVLPDTAPPDVQGTGGFDFVLGAPSDQLPTLPPPPSESPPAPSPPVEHRTDTGQKSRRARKEVDEANIIISTRSRAPTTRKRVADEDVSEQPQKKAKRK
ncbi:hypothetical protein C8R47DRAFT_1296991 [Mycena vitilis]|nr:hypothetical protein C8R47DRAFT_1084967 [Mycena vitilis]KAJ6472222.1 hypothetical protein C8R47DRAFT_1296991 [Mycena vitilis]